MRRLICLTSTHGKTPEEVATEVMESYARYQPAMAKAQETTTGPPPEGDEPIGVEHQAKTRPSTAR
jgi:hypothetical protein